MDKWQYDILNSAYKDQLWICFDGLYKRLSFYSIEVNELELNALNIFRFNFTIIRHIKWENLITGDPHKRSWL